MMEGTPSDALRDFENVMTVLQHGAADHYDAASFVSACAAFCSKLDPAELEKKWEDEIRNMNARTTLQRTCAVSPPIGLHIVF